LITVLFTLTSFVHSGRHNSKKKSSVSESVAADTLTPFLTTLQGHLIRGTAIEIVASNDVEKCVLDNMTPLVQLLSNFYKDIDDGLLEPEKKCFAQRAFYYGFMVGTEAFFVSDIIAHHAQEVYRIVYPVFKASGYSKCRALLPFIKGVLEGIAYDKVIRPKGYFLDLIDPLELQDQFCNGCQALPAIKERIKVSSVLIDVSMDPSGAYFCRLSLTRIAYFAGASLVDDMNDEAIAAREALIASSLFEGVSARSVSRRSEGVLSGSVEEKKGDDELRAYAGAGSGSSGEPLSTTSFLDELEATINRREALPFSSEDSVEDEILSCMRFLVGMINSIDLIGVFDGRYFSDYAFLRGFSLGAESTKNVGYPCEEELMVKMFARRLYAAVEKDFFLSTTLERLPYFCFARGILDGIAYKRVALKLGKNIKINSLNPQKYFTVGSSDYRKFVLKKFTLDRLHFALQVDAALLASVSEVDLKFNFDSIAYLAGLNSIHNINDEAIQRLIEDVDLRVCTAVEKRNLLAVRDVEAASVPVVSAGAARSSADDVEKILPFISEYKKNPTRDLDSLSDFQQGFFCGVFNYSHVNRSFLHSTAIALYESLMVNKDLSTNRVSFVDGIIEGYLFAQSGKKTADLSYGARAESSLYESGLFLTIEQAYDHYKNFFESTGRPLNLDDLEYLCGHLTSQSLAKISCSAEGEAFVRPATKDHVRSLLPQDQGPAGAGASLAPTESLPAPLLIKKPKHFLMEFYCYNKEKKASELLQFMCRREYFEKGLFEAQQIFKETHVVMSARESVNDEFIQLKEQICGNNIEKLVSQLKTHKTSALLDELSYEIGYSRGISRMREIEGLKDSCPG